MKATTKYGSLSWKPRSHVRILIHRTRPIKKVFLRIFTRKIQCLAVMIISPTRLIFLLGILITMLNNCNWLSFSSHSQLFQANRDQNSIMKNAINPPILARYVKLNPRGWYRHICMRIEYYGCVAGKFLFFLCNS